MLSLHIQGHTISDWNCVNQLCNASHIHTASSTTVRFRYFSQFVQLEHPPQVHHDMGDGTTVYMSHVPHRHRLWRVHTGLLRSNDDPCPETDPCGFCRPRRCVCVWCVCVLSVIHTHTHTHSLSLSLSLSAGRGGNPKPLNKDQEHQQLT